MTTITMRSLLAALALLVSPASASAECAWVLWGVITERGAPGPFLINAHESKAACEEKPVERWAKAEEQGKKMAYMCFPDTIDPRGPKGGQ